MLPRSPLMVALVPCGSSAADSAAALASIESASSSFVRSSMAALRNIVGGGANESDGVGRG